MSALTCATCSRTRLPLVTTPNTGVTLCLPCMYLDGDPSVGAGRTFVLPETVCPLRGWALGARVGLSWPEVKAAVVAGAPRADVREPPLAGLAPR